MNKINQITKKNNIKKFIFTIFCTIFSSNIFAAILAFETRTISMFIPFRASILNLENSSLMSANTKIININSNDDFKFSDKFSIQSNSTVNVIFTLTPLTHSDGVSKKNMNWYVKQGTDIANANDLYFNTKTKTTHTFLKPEDNLSNNIYSIIILSDTTSAKDNKRGNYYGTFNINISKPIIE